MTAPSTKKAFAGLAAALATLTLAAAASADGLTIDQAVATALKRNRDAIAAELDIEAVQLDRVAAGVYPNPQFSYTVGNIVLGNGNPQGGAVNPGPFDQLVHTFAVSEIIDVWNKRGTRIAAADRNVEYKRLQVEDALREIVYSVRSAVTDLAREQAEDRLARETRDRYAETIRLTKVRRDAGEISDTDFKKIELEGMRLQAAAMDESVQLEEAKSKLGGLLGLPASAAAQLKVDESPPPRTPMTAAALVRRAFDSRPDVRALKASHAYADATLTQARREALPDISLGVAYTHSGFTVSGDNPNSLALTLSLPIPVFDRNQAAIGKANLELRRHENEAQKIYLSVQREVADAARREERSRTLVDLYEGGMLSRAEQARDVAEKSYRAGSISLLELLEAQRTYNETRVEYLKALNGLWQGRVDVAHATGEGVR
jgi:outer membrane protein, heavy metal efflux system